MTSGAFLRLLSAHTPQRANRSVNILKKSINAHKSTNINKSPLIMGGVGGDFLMSETQKGYSGCTPIKWWVVHSKHMHMHTIYRVANQTHAYAHKCTQKQKKAKCMRESSNYLCKINELPQPYRGAVLFQKLLQRAIWHELSY